MNERDEQPQDGIIYKGESLGVTKKIVVFLLKIALRLHQNPLIYYRDGKAVAILHYDKIKDGE